MDQTSSVLRNSRREALFVGAVWLASCIYTVGYAALFAYRQEAPPELLWGIPTWVVWGILAPWAAVTALTCWYALCAMKDEDLGEDAPVPDGEGTGEPRHG
jgi:hypothetical protein